MPIDGASKTSGVRSTLTSAAQNKRKRDLPPAAERALAEAAERRRRIDAAAAARPRELDGRGGTEPARYGDWEVKGIASDF